MDRDGRSGTAKDVSTLDRALFGLKDFLGLEGPALPCGPGFGSEVKAPQSRWSLEKLPAVRRDIMAMATSQALVMGT